MRAELLQLAADLARKGEPFVLAMVVRKQAYSSAQQGDMAVITADGGYHGWLGGNCTQPTVKREARRALAEGTPRLVSLSPEPDSESRPGIVALPMTCHSGGTVEIYLEPVLPAPRLLLFGDSPCARALAQLAKAAGYWVDAVAPGPVPQADRVFVGPAAPDISALAMGSARKFAVVATMGEADEDSIVAALSARPEYVSVVASRKRFAEIRESLLARGISAQAIDGVKNPAGLDIGARLPEEVAVSILAEIVQLRRANAEARPATEEPFGGIAGRGSPNGRSIGDEPAAETLSELDPVCGMTVVVARARHKAEHGDRTFYFCNARCRERFLAEPARYLNAAAGA
jgi:xanthine dehydrogenase accessory factor